MNNKNKVEVTDSTDWDDTSIPLLSSVEASLRCQICKDFYNAAVITSCLHTFCSSCIRRAISADGKCPSCRSNVQEHGLRRNVIIQEVVEAFQNARSQALEVAKAGREHANTESPSTAIRRSKRKREDEEGQGPRRRSQRKKAKQNTNGIGADDPMVIDDSEEEQGDEYTPEDEDATEQPDDGLVSCPICNQRMKEDIVFDHIPTCDGSSNPAKEKPVKSRPAPQQQIHQPPKQIRPPPERLPQLNYSLMKERDLKNKLQQVGIPNWGSKDLLTRRHKEYVNIVNSNFDSLRPKGKRELLSELDQWERTQGGNSGRGLTTSTDVMKKDFDGEGWMKNNKADFDSLIANARKGRKKALESKDESKDATKEEVKHPPHETHRNPPKDIILNDTTDSANIPSLLNAAGNVTDTQAEEGSVPAAVAFLAEQKEAQHVSTIAADEVTMPLNDNMPTMAEPNALNNPNPSLPMSRPPPNPGTTYPRRKQGSASTTGPTTSISKPASAPTSRLSSQESTDLSTSPAFPTARRNSNSNSTSNPTSDLRIPYRRTSTSSPVPGFSVPAHSNSHHDARMIAETNSVGLDRGPRLPKVPSFQSQGSAETDFAYAASGLRKQWRRDDGKGDDDRGGDAAFVTTVGGLEGMENDASGGTMANGLSKSPTKMKAADVAGAGEGKSGVDVLNTANEANTLEGPNAHITNRQDAYTANNETSKHDGNGHGMDSGDGHERRAGYETTV